MISPMFGENDTPEYALLDDDYNYCRNQTEYIVLRLLKTYIDIVLQRYATKLASPRINLKPGSTDFRDTHEYFRAFTKIAEQLTELEDPEDFMAYVFEMYIAEGKADTGHKAERVLFHKRNGKWNDVYSKPGMGYPSMKYIARHGQQMVEEFNRLTFEPSAFILQGKVDRGDFCPGVRLDKKIERWCPLHKQTEEDYWSNPVHWGPVFLRPKTIRKSESLKRSFKAIAATAGTPDASLEEVYEALEDLLGAHKQAQEDAFIATMKRKKAMRKKNLRPQFENVKVADPNYEWLGAVGRERAFAFQKAIDGGKDPMDPDIQAEIEAEVNPVDKDHPDTLMYFVYGKGSPRRLDGSVVPDSELKRR